jgi:hypothetical protein
VLSLLHPTSHHHFSLQATDRHSLSTPSVHWLEESAFTSRPYTSCLLHNIDQSIITKTARPSSTSQLLRPPIFSLCRKFSRFDPYNVQKLLSCPLFKPPPRQSQQSNILFASIQHTQHLSICELLSIALGVVGDGLGAHQGE